jgi:PAS domain-containing protein
VVHLHITQRVVSQRALLGAHNYLHTITNSMGEGLVAIDAAGRVTFLNGVAEKLLGWSLPEVRGRVMHDLTHKHRSDGTEIPLEVCPITQRVREPAGHIVGPGAYLPLAEHCGLIGAIDRWVIQRGAQLAGRGYPVQVNVSAHSISDQTVLSHIEHCIEQTGADPRLLALDRTHHTC